MSKIPTINTILIVIFSVTILMVLTAKLYLPSTRHSTNTITSIPMNIDQLIAPLDQENNITLAESNNYIIHVFAPWCQACTTNHAPLMQFAKANSLRIYGIFFNTTEAEYKKWQAHHPNMYDALFTSTSPFLTTELALTGIPEIFFVGKNQQILYSIRGNFHSKIANDITQLYIQ